MTNLFPHGWAHYLGGGLVIGVAVVLLFAATGRLAGMSSVFSAVWSFVSDRPFFQQPRWRASRGWRLQLAAGLVGGAALYWWGFGPGAAATTDVPTWRLVAGGLLAGWGARLAGGCTSGHGICGIGSLKGASLLATVVFMATAIVTAQVLAR